MKDYLSYIRPNIRRLTPYSSARNEYSGKEAIFLDANENPFDNDYNRYPDPLQQQLKEKLSALKGVPAAQIFVGNGSDEAIDLCYRIFCEPRIDNAVTIVPSYGMYRVAGDINDVEVREVPLRPDFSLPVEELLAAAYDHSKLLILCSPNNPTANAFPREQLLYLVEHFDGMVVVDEAYIDFSSQGSLLGELATHPNLIVLQTLSKAWGLAGLRLGLAFASPHLMGVFAAVKYPYNINVAAQRIALEMLQRNISIEVIEIKRERVRVAYRLQSAPCVKKVWPSDANFLLVEVEQPRPLYEALVAARIIVRDRSSVPGCKGCLRLTIGTPKENEQMLNIIENYPS